MPVLGRPRAFDRDAALQAAVEVFWRQGFLATSMNDLCAAMGIRSPSLYAAFGSKEALYAEAIGRYSAAADEMIWNHVDGSATVREGMQTALLAAAGVVAGREGMPSGCMVTLATGEECPGGSPDTARYAREGSLAKLRAGLQRAMAAGELPQTTIIDRLARFYLGVVQGMAIQGRDGADLADLQDMARTAMAAWPEK